MPEDPLVGVAFEAAQQITAPPLFVERGAALLYQVTVNNRLALTVDPRKPSRGRSAFQTDLSVFEEVEENIRIPRVVVEFKSRLTTHDVLTYSTKARKHKQVYPYLRYGLMMTGESVVPGRFFTHNEALDFCIAAAAYTEGRMQEIMMTTLEAELEASRCLEGLASGSIAPHVFRMNVAIDVSRGKLR